MASTGMPNTSDTEGCRGGQPPAAVQLFLFDWLPTSATGPLGCLLLFSGAILSGAALFNSVEFRIGFKCSWLDSIVVIYIALMKQLTFSEIEVPQQDVPGFCCYRWNPLARFVNQ